MVSRPCGSLGGRTLCLWGSPSPPLLRGLREARTIGQSCLDLTVQARAAPLKRMATAAAASTLSSSQAYAVAASTLDGVDPHTPVACQPRSPSTGHSAAGHHAAGGAAAAGGGRAGADCGRGGGLVPPALVLRRKLLPGCRPDPRRQHQQHHWRLLPAVQVGRPGVGRGAGGGRGVWAWLLPISRPSSRPPNAAPLCSPPAAKMTGASSGPTARSPRRRGEPIAAALLLPPQAAVRTVPCTAPLPTCSASAPVAPQV